MTLVIKRPPTNLCSPPARQFVSISFYARCYPGVLLVLVFTAALASMTMPLQCRVFEPVPVSLPAGWVAAGTLLWLGDDTLLMIAQHRVRRVGAYALLRQDGQTGRTPSWISPWKAFAMTSLPVRCWPSLPSMDGLHRSAIGSPTAVCNTSPTAAPSMPAPSDRPGWSLDSRGLARQDGEPRLLSLAASSGEPRAAGPVNPL